MTNLSSKAGAQYGAAASTTVSAEASQAVESFLYPEAKALPEEMRRAGGSTDAAPIDAQAPAWASAVRESEERARSAYAAALEVQRADLARAVDEFARQRTAYFLAVEKEAVQLILAIGRKILEREARADPLALAAMVHVALEPLHTGTTVALHVHPAAAQDWRLYFAARGNGLPSLEAQPQVVEDSSVPEGECHLQTEMGTATLSLSQQMETIEASFLDLLAQRPAVSA